MRVLRLLPLAALILLPLALAVTGSLRDVSPAGLLRHDAALRGLVDGNPLLALAGFILLYAMVTAASLPIDTLLTLSGGYLFGTWLGGAATVLGATFGAVLVYAAVRTSLGGILRARLGRSSGRLRAMIAEVQAGAFGYMLALRLLPLAPFPMVNIAGALAGVPFRAYAVATFLGIMPATFIYSGFGAGLGEVVARGRIPDLSLLSHPQFLLPLLALGLLSLVTTRVRRFRSRLETKE